MEAEGKRQERDRHARLEAVYTAEVLRRHEKLPAFEKVLGRKKELKTDEELEAAMIALDMRLERMERTR